MRSWLITAAVLILVGALLIGATLWALGGDFSRLSSTPYQTNVHTPDGKFSDLTLLTSTADVTVLPHDEGTAKVVCVEHPKRAHAVTVANDTLIIEEQDTRKWYEHLSVGFATSVTVYLPRQDYDTFRLQLSTGNVTLQDLHLRTLDLSLSTGDSYLSAVLVDGPLTLTASTGDVLLEACDASDIEIQTSTGDVKGSFLTDKAFLATSSTGRVTVPATEGDPCRITASTGDIHFSAP